VKPCGSCARGSGHVEDEGWQPRDPRAWDGKRYPGDGLVTCGACEGDGHEAPNGVWPNIIAPPMHDNPATGWTDPRLPDFELIWQLAREAGYSIGIHGSLKRDVDLIAAPWTEEAVGNAELIDRLCAGLNAKRISGPEYKPHGRVAVNLQVDGYVKTIDLSILPREPKS
jgi:hypothetical protein